MQRLHHIKVVGIVASLSVLFASFSALTTESEADLNRDASEALKRLYSLSPAARRAGESAKAVLVFPNIVTTSSSTAAQHIYGTLLVNAWVIGYYKVVGSYSVPKGVQKFGYALFFMSDEDLVQLRNSAGREIRTGLGVVVAEKTRTQSNDQRLLLRSTVKPTN